jgi:hypothetical protein
MGLTTRRAVCRDCLGKGDRPGDVVLRKWLAVALAAVALVVALVVLWP